LLEDWYERFGIVITGQAQQTQDLLEGVTDAAAYENNVRYLEERLISLGLAERLSDQCAYVRHGVKDDV
jgi:hypothetical protein